MISKEGITFKNCILEELLNKYRVYYGPAPINTMSLSLQEKGEAIISGYCYSLLYDVMMNTLGYKKWIDFSYDTLHNLPFVLKALYHFQKNQGYSDIRNADVVTKTIGAVMYCLAMNEHGAKLIVERGKCPPLWADSLNIYVEANKKTDFLQPALQTLRTASVVINGGGYWFEMTPIINAYKETTGVNIAEYGIGNIMINN